MQRTQAYSGQLPRTGGVEFVVSIENRDRAVMTLVKHNSCCRVERLKHIKYKCVV